MTTTAEVNELHDLLLSTLDNMNFDEGVTELDDDMVMALLDDTITTTTTANNDGGRGSSKFTPLHFKHLMDIFADDNENMTKPGSNDQPHNTVVDDMSEMDTAAASDSDSHDDILSSTSTCSHSEQRNGQPQQHTVLPNFVPRAKYAVDYLDPIAIPTEFNSTIVAQRNELATIQFDTVFCKKYYRFDTKVLQCFPQCDKFRDVREARLLGLEHGICETRKNGGAWCSNNVVAVIYVDPSVPITDMYVRSRIVTAVNDASSTQAPPPIPNIMHVGQQCNEIPSDMNICGTMKPKPATQGKQVAYQLVLQSPHASGWKHDVELPRHRRNIGQKGARISVPLFAMEITIFLQLPVAVGGGFQVISRATSTLFEIASVRTLLREAFVFKQSLGLVVAGGGGGAREEQVGGNPKGHISQNNANKKSKSVRRFQRTMAGESAVVGGMGRGDKITQLCVAPKPGDEDLVASSSSSDDNADNHNNSQLSLLGRFIKMVIG